MRKKSFPILLSILLFLLGCWGGNVKYESQNVEKEVKRRKIKLVFENGFSIDYKYRVYFFDMVKNYFLRGTELVVVDEGYNFVATTFISNFSDIITSYDDYYRIRLDFIAKVDVISSNGNFVMSNQIFSYTFITNSPYDTFNDPFKKTSFMEGVYNKFFEDTALNFVYFIATGWKDDYGYYTIKDSIFQRILGGSTNETTKRTNKRNIPIVGGE